MSSRRINTLAWLAVVLGVMAGEFWLHAPSLVGQKLLMPGQLLGQKVIRGQQTPGVPPDILHMQIDMVT